MQENLKYKNSFLIIAYCVLIQFFILSFYEIPMITAEKLQNYIALKVVTALMFLLFIYLVHSLKFIKYWVIIFNVCSFIFVLGGEFFSPGYHFSVIQFMFISAIVFDGFPLMATVLMVLYMIEYSLLPFFNSAFLAYPSYHAHIFNALLSSWVISWSMELYVNRVKNKQNFLDRKLRYKGIKTDLFVHDLKNRFQPLMQEFQDNPYFIEILEKLEGFNSFQDEKEITFSDLVLKTKEKFKIVGEFSVFGDEDFFIDQMDLQTILCNLMTNSQKASQLKNISLQVKIRNNKSGCSYEDNAGGFTDEQYKFFTQKVFTPYPGHEKNGVGLLLVKKLIIHNGGKLAIKRIPNGTRFEINY